MDKIDPVFYKRIKFMLHFNYKSLKYKAVCYNKRVKLYIKNKIQIKQ